MDGGLVAAGVADRVPEPTLIYFDAFAPDNGQSWLCLAGECYRQIAVERSRHDGSTVLPHEGLDLRCRRRPHPPGSFLEALDLTKAARPILLRLRLRDRLEATPITMSAPAERCRLELHGIA